MKTSFPGNIRKVTSGILVAFSLFCIINPWGNFSFATVNMSGNSIVGANNGYVNISNSGSYPITLNFNGTLNVGDVVYLDLMSGGTKIGNTLSGSSGGSSSLTLNSNLSSWTSGGVLSLSGSIQNSSGVTYVTGIQGSVFGDFVAPNMPIFTLLDPINNVQKTAVTMTGTAENNATLMYSVSDGVITVSGVGTASSTGVVSITGIDVTALSDGVLTGSLVAVDAAGNRSMARTDTAMKDTIPPTITLVGSGTVNLTYGSSYTDPGAVWSDGSSTGTLTASGVVNTFVAGTYTLNYSKTDAVGNTRIVSRTVIVASQYPSGSIPKDVCPRGDYTVSYYDGMCGTPSSLSGATIVIKKEKNKVTVTTTTASGVTFTTVFSIPGQVLKSLRDVKFKDIKSNWAKGYIEKLASRGVVDNVEHFNPDNRLTRAEFLKMVIDAAGLNASATGSTAVFSDVAVGSWYNPYVSLALSMELISNRSTRFRPNDSISRAEAAKIIVRAFSGSPSNRNISFTDVDMYSDLTAYIETAKELGFFSGQVVNGKLKFRPHDSITRAEIAKVIANAFGL